MFPLKDSVGWTKFPIITLLLVFANIVCFLFEVSIPGDRLESFVLAHGVVPANFWCHFGWQQLNRIITSMFLHAGFAHLFGNLWFLWLFGDGLEGQIGRVRFFLLYFCTGICAAVVQIVIEPSSPLPMIGASGAISGILGSYFSLFPRATVTSVILFGWMSRLVEVPANFYLGFWFILQLASGIFGLMGASDQGAIAVWAHAGGFVAGMVAGSQMHRHCLAES
jgi:membrane associated rhomboid family serine protease